MCGFLNVSRPFQANQGCEWGIKPLSLIIILQCFIAKALQRMENSEKLLTNVLKLFHGQTLAYRMSIGLSFQL